MGNRKRETELSDLLQTDRIELDTVEEVPVVPGGPAITGLSDTKITDPMWNEDTDLEERTVVNSTAHLSDGAKAVFDRLQTAGVKARSYSGMMAFDPDRRRDWDSARKFDDALSMLTQGQVEAAFYAFTELLEERPHSTRLWIFVRAIAQARSVAP